MKSTKIGIHWILMKPQYLPFYLKISTCAVEFFLPQSNYPPFADTWSRWGDWEVTENLTGKKTLQLQALKSL